MNRIAALRVNWTKFIDRFSNDIDHPAERALADWNGDGSARVFGGHPSNHAFGRLQRDGSDAAFAQMLLHFGHDVDLLLDIESVTRNF